MFIGFLTEAVNTSTGSEMADRKQILLGLGEIEELNINEECVIEAKSNIGKLRNLE